MNGERLNVAMLQCNILSLIIRWGKIPFYSTEEKGLNVAINNKDNSGNLQK